jgi:hypothetical protein
MKDAYYFSHDSNARNDQRLMKVRMKYGAEGYGIYFMIIEILRDIENYTLHISDLESVCFDIRSDNDKVLDIIKNYNLFEFEGDYFHSKSLSRRMEKLDKIKIKRRESGKKGAIATAKNRQMPKSETASAIPNAEQVKKSKVKKSKEEKSKEDIIKERTDGFKKQVFEFQSKYDKDILEEFVLYWTEPNKSKTRLKYQMEDTWDTGRRLARWASRNFNSNQSPSQKFQKNGKLDEEIKNGHNNLVKQSKRFRKYIENAGSNAAEPKEIREILGSTFKKLKPATEEEEGKDGQQDLYRD